MNVIKKLEDIKKEENDNSIKEILSDTIDRINKIKLNNIMENAIIRKFLIKN
jgi:hypothetical protein